MINIPVAIKILIGVIYGIVLGIVVVPLSKGLTLKRTEDPVKAAVLDTKLFKVMSIVVGVVSSVAVMLTVSDVVLAIRNLILLIPIASIAIVDSLVRKIPNPMLLVMIIVQAIYLIYYSIVNHSTKGLLAAVFGFFIGFAACTLPAVLKVPVGNGDVKYSAVIGLCIYFTGFIQSMVLMGVLALVCLAYLKITGKGGLKTLIPMGPLISLGSVITMCFPFLEHIIAKAIIF